MGSCHDFANQELLLVMEYMSLGSLNDVLKDPKVNYIFNLFVINLHQIQLTNDMRLHLASQAAQGMNFLHQSTPPIQHRDLKVLLPSYSRFKI